MSTPSSRNLPDAHAGTEWFSVHEALLAHVAELAAGVDDPWTEYERWVLRRLALGGA